MKYSSNSQLMYSEHSVLCFISPASLYYQKHNNPASLFYTYFISIKSSKYLILSYTKSFVESGDESFKIMQ